MNKRLHTRLALIIIGIAAGIVLISTISVILTTHYHFSLYQAQAGMTHELPELNYHLEQAMMQTIIWTCFVAIVLAVFLGFYVAKRISAPLVHMTRVAERMTDGEWSTRVDIKGKDELADLGASLNTLAEQLQQHEQLRVTMTEDIAQNRKRVARHGRRAASEKIPCRFKRAHPALGSQGRGEPQGGRNHAVALSTDDLAAIGVQNLAR